MNNLFYLCYTQPTVPHLISSLLSLTVSCDELKQDQDAIDFTDNDISTLTNFPLSPRLRTLLLARNRVTTVAATLSRSLPNLTTLVLTHNNVAELADLDPLSGFARLTHLVLMENPVAAKEVSLQHLSTYLSFCYYVPFTLMCELHSLWLF